MGTSSPSVGIPTLSEWGMILLALFLLALGTRQLAGRRIQAG